MMADNMRPMWDFKLSESKVRKLCGDIKKVTHHWEMTGADTARHWIEFHWADGGKFVAPQGWRDMFEFAPDERGLIQPNHQGKQAIKVLCAIDDWQKQNAADIAELKRLQEKLGIAEKEGQADG